MEATKKLTGKSVKKWLGNNAIIVLMLLVSLFVGIIHPNFFAPANLINLFKNVSIRYIIALGISGCLITTGNDLSAGRLAGFAACLACIFAQTEGAAGKFYPNMPTLPTPVVFILVIAICAIVGLCNGLVVCLPEGPALYRYPGYAAGRLRYLPGLHRRYPHRLPEQELYLSGLQHHPEGPRADLDRPDRGLSASGSCTTRPVTASICTPSAATRLLLRLPVSTSTPPRSASTSWPPACLVWQAACWLQSPAAHPSTLHMGYELDAIAASTIGGVSTTGGVGTVPGILVGVLVFELMKVALQFMNVNSSYTYIVQGLVIIVAVAIDIRKYLAKK